MYKYDLSSELNQKIKTKNRKTKVKSNKKEIRPKKCRICPVDIPILFSKKMLRHFEHLHRLSVIFNNFSWKLKKKASLITPRRTIILKSQK